MSEKMFYAGDVFDRGLYYTCADSAIKGLNSSINSISCDGTISALESKIASSDIAIDSISELIDYNSVVSTKVDVCDFTSAIDNIKKSVEEVGKALKTMADRLGMEVTERGRVERKNEF